MTEENSHLLIGWKQIAAYLRCASSTARRQARDKGLPVFRVGGSVRARTADIDRWLEAQPRTKSEPDTGAAPQALVVGSAELPMALSDFGGRAGQRYAVIPLGTEEAEFVRIQELLRSAEEKYQRLVEQVPAWIWETNAAGEFTYSNPRSSQILGYEPDDFAGFAPTEFAVAPEDTESFERYFGEVRRKGSLMKGFRCRFVHRDGTLRWLETDAEPAFDGTGKFAGVRGVSRDVTEAVQAEAALQETHDRLTATLDALPDLLFEVDRNGLIYDYRTTDKDKLYVPPEDFLEQAVGELLPPEATQVILEAIAEAASTGSHSGGQYELEMSGEVHWFELSISSLGDHRNPECRFIVLVRDITDRKRAETELRVHRDRLEELVEERTAELREVNVGLEREIAERKRVEKELEEQRNQLQTITTVTPDLLVLLDRDFVYRAVNPAFCHFTGKKEEELVGRTDFDVFPREVAEVYRRSDEEVFSSGVLHILEREATDADGITWWLQVAKAPIFDAEGEVNGLVVSARDITERRLAEEALRESEAKFRNLAERSPNMIFINAHGKIVYANEKCEEIMGYTRRDFYGPEFDFLTLIAPSSRETIEQAFSAHSRGEDIGPNEYTLITRNGRYIEVIITTKLIMYDGERAILGIITDVTERKRAEEALRESEERYRELVETSPDAITLVDMEDRIAAFNRPGAAMFGFDDPKYIVGRSIFDFIAREESKESVKADLQKAAEEGAITNVSYDAKRKDGSIFPTESNATVVRGRDGKPKGFIIVTRDVTQRKLAEKALYESEEKYRDLFENANDLIQSVTPEGRFLYVNRAWKETLGYDGDEIRGLNLFDVIHPECLPQCQEVFKSVLGGERVDNIEVTFLTKGGREVILEGSANCRFEADLPISTRGIFRDITERKRAEAALRESEERYRLLADNASDVILTMDLNLRFTYVSPAAQPLLGYTPDEMRAKSLIDIATPDSFTDAAKALAEELAVEVAGSQDLTRSRTVSVDLVREDGSVVCVEAKAIFLRDPNDDAIGILAVARDVTERNRAEAALRKSEERLKLATEAGHLGLWDCNVITEELIFDERYAQQLGFERKELPPCVNAWNELLHPEDREWVVEVIKEHLAGETPEYEMEYRMLSKDGGWRWILDRGKVVARSESGRPLRAAGTHQDITARKEAEERVGASEKLYRALFNLSSDAVILVGTDGTVRDVNANGYAWFGFRPEDIIGKKFDDLEALPDETKKKTAAVFTRRLAGEEISPYEVELASADGTIGRFRIRGDILRNEEGEAVAVLVMLSPTSREDEAAG